MARQGSDHRGGTDWGGITFLIGLIAVFAAILVGRARQLPASSSAGGFDLLVVMVGMVGFIWLLFAFYWVRGRLRSTSVRRKMPSAAVFEVVAGYELAARVVDAEKTYDLPAPRIWSQTYLTVAAAPDGLWFFGGSILLVQRGHIPAEYLHSVSVKTVDFDTRTVTRHFPAIAVDAGDRLLPIEMLPMRTTLLVPRKLSASAG